MRPEMNSMSNLDCPSAQPAKEDGDPELQSSQASSHFLLGPVSGSTLLALENARRERLRRKGTLRTGCREIDEQVLVHGFERGCVAGISAEDIDMGLLLGLQTIAHNLIVHGPERRPHLRRAAIITTLAAPTILPLLRDVIRSHVEAKLGLGGAEAGARVRECLERISVSRVFDIEGLWEVLTELEAEAPQHGGLDVAEDVHAPAEEVPVPPAAQAEPESSPLSSPPSSIVDPEPVPLLRTERTEVLDSEDEGDLLSLSPASSASHSADSQPVLPVAEATPASPPNNQTEDDNDFPGIIFVTHFPTLLNALFGQRDKSSAHSTLQLLSSHMRYLSNSLGSLVLLLNSTTSTPSHAATSKPFSPGAPNTPVPPGNKPSERPLDPTLRSIFNPLPAAHTGYGPGSLALSRRNKPAFGLSFSQFLDLHLLCTRLPRSCLDAESLSAPHTTTTATHAPRERGRAGHNVRYAWVIEVLLDESGCCDVATGARTDREQRWGAVDWKEGVGIVDAFPKQDVYR